MRLKVPVKKEDERYLKVLSGGGEQGGREPGRVGDGRGTGGGGGKGGKREF